MPATDALKSKIKAMLVRQLKLEMKPEEIDDGAPLFGGGLGLDSIDVLEVVASLEGVRRRDSEPGGRRARAHERRWHRELPRGEGMPHLMPRFVVEGACSR
jgi:acyl carrier protein